MSDVLSDEQLYETFQRAFNHAPDDGRLAYATKTGARAVERAVVAALAARGGVDVEALVVPHSIACNSIRLTNDDGTPWDCTCQSDDFADALRLALATAEARHAEELAEAIDQKETWMRCQINDSKNHAEREAMWRELDRVCLNNGSVVRERELRRALGLEV